MCSQSTLQQVLIKTAKRAREIFSDALVDVVLYGSYARGDYDGDSDIDVMVLVDMDRNELARYRKVIGGFVHELDREYNFDFMLSIVLQDAETFRRYRNASAFFRNVSKEGVSVNA